MKAQPVFVAYKEGVFWNVTTDEESVVYWLESGAVECYQKFQPDGELVFGPSCGGAEQ